MKSQDGHTTVRQFVSEWQRMVRHPEYTADQIRELMTIYRQVFQAERTYLIQQYEIDGRLSEDLFNRLYREITMVEMVVLDHGVTK